LAARLSGWKIDIKSEAQQELALAEEQLLTEVDESTEQEVDS